MGTSFNNFHIYKGDIEQVRAALDNKYTVVALSPDWVTVVDESTDYKLRDVAGSLSKVIQEPVLYFAYHDDDYFAIVLFQSGKSVSECWNDYTGKAKSKNSKVLLALLDLDETHEKRIREIIKCEDLNKIIQLFEELFGVALWIDVFHLKEDEKSYVTERSDKYYQQWIAGRKKTAIKNKTKAVLLQEIDTKMTTPRFYRGDGNLFFFIYKNESGIYSPRRGGEYFSLCDGELRPLFSKEIRFFEGQSFLGVNGIYHSNDTITMVNGVSGRMPTDIQTLPCYSVDEVYYAIDHHIIQVNKEGTPTWVHDFPNETEEYGLVENGISNNDTFCYTRTGGTGRFLRIQSGEVIWQSDTAPNSDFFNMIPRMRDGCIYFIDRESVNSKVTLYKMDSKSNLTSTAKSDSNMSEIFFSKDFIFYLSTTWGVDKSQRLIKLDLDLNLMQSVELPKNLHVSRINTINEDLRTLYCSSYMNVILAFNVDTMEYREKKQDFDIHILQTAGKNGEYLINGGLSSLYVMDPNMNLLSKHRLKGSIYRIHTEKDRTFIITGTGDTSYWGGKEGLCYARLYEIVPNKTP